MKYSNHAREIAEYLPIDRILTETDNPGGPKGFLGEPGEPSLILDVLEALAALKGINKVELEQIVRSNLLDLIGDDAHLQSLRTLLKD